MKKNYKKLASLFIAAGLTVGAVAQDEISSLFKAGATDLNKIAEGYLTPMGNGFAANLGSNWYNTAAPHKLFGFDITVGGGIATAPTADQTFSLLGLQNLKVIGAQKTAPTFAGSGDGVPVKLVQPATIGGVANPNAGQTITEFSTPPGILNAVPGINAQLGLGLPFGTELNVRFVPTITASGFDMGLWGIGIKHDVKQWIPVVKLLPFDASVFLGYTKFSLNYAFPASAQITPDKLVSGGAGFVAPAGTNYNNQKLEMSASAFTGNILISKKLLFFTPYLGLGFTKTSFNLGLKGNYPLIGNPILTGADAGKMQVNVMKDPITVDPSNFMPGATVGFRLKFLWVIAIHAQYTFQKYPVASGGFGINFR